MGRRLQTIYEYFSDYSEKEIDDMIYSLSIEEKLIIRARFGDDLHNPQQQENWGKEFSEKYYGTLIPKMKRLLSKGIDLKQEQVVKQPQQDIIEQTILIPETPKIEIIDYTPTLLQLLKSGKNNSEICEELKISSQQLYEELLKLKNKGIRHSRKYYSDGTIKYGNISTMQDLRNYNGLGQDRTIITDTNENSMKVLVISDLHFGNELERIDLINRAYNYCVKNGINIILCGGDIIDGAYTKGTQKISDLYQQIEYFIKNYPYDKSILTFSVAGDHDISAFNKLSIDLVESIKLNGLLVPIVVRRKENDRYELLSGHRRKLAYEILGLKEIDTIIKNLNDDEATIFMVDSNMYREKLLPSEKAFAYRMKMEAMKHQVKK